MFDLLAKSVISVTSTKQLARGSVQNMHVNLGHRVASGVGRVAARPAARLHRDDDRPERCFSLSQVPIREPLVLNSSKVPRRHPSILSSEDITDK